MRLIDADLPMRSFQVDMCGSFTCHECPLLNDDGECGFEVFISDTPTVDAEPVPHGHWEYVNTHQFHTYYSCSECGNVTDDYIFNNQTLQYDKLYYCPNCGAKMDEVEK